MGRPIKKLSTLRLQEHGFHVNKTRYSIWCRRLPALPGCNALGPKATAGDVVIGHTVTSLNQHSSSPMVDRLSYCHTGFCGKYPIEYPRGL